MRIVDARRIRGPSLGAKGPGAIVEVALERGEHAQPAIRAARRSLAWMSARLGQPAMSRGAIVRTFEGGFALSVPASIDRLEPAVDVLEWAVDDATEKTDRERAAERLRAELARHRDPALLATERAARKHRLPLLYDDTHVTLGYATTSVTYALGAIPPPKSVPWKTLAAIPVALVTGTNGKTTTTRLVARIAKHAGLVPGITSSDGTAIDEAIVEAGDNTGGESARAVLRDPRVQIAILETARGGLLRRGLAVTNVDAALITNVTADHLGEHGVLDLKTLVATKAVVGHAVKKGGKLVLGADDPQLRKIASTFAAERVLFAIDPKNVRRHRGHAFVLYEGSLVHVHGRSRDVLVRVDEVPITDGGRAVHNVKNALAAAALAFSLGLPRDAIVAGLRSFGAADNPGRGHVVTTNGVRVLFDFGHNPAAAKELYGWARTLGKNVLAVITQPGDRTDAAMQAFARAVAESGVARTFVWESESLLRGRAHGWITRTLMAASTHATKAKSEADAIRAALKAAKKGDVVVVSPSLDRGLP